MLAELAEAASGSDRIRYVEGGLDARNYRVSFDKIADRLGFEPDFRVPIAVHNLVGAIGAGAFDDFDERPNFYRNRVIRAGVE
jgi:hypothetical protein